MKIGQEAYVVFPVYCKVTVVNVDSEKIYVKFCEEIMEFDKATKVGWANSNMAKILYENIDEVKQIQKTFHLMNNTKLL